MGCIMPLIKIKKNDKIVVDDDAEASTNFIVGCLNPKGRSKLIAILKRGYISNDRLTIDNTHQCNDKIIDLNFYAMFNHVEIVGNENTVKLGVIDNNRNDSGGIDSLTLRAEKITPDMLHTPIIITANLNIHTDDLQGIPEHIKSPSFPPDIPMTLTLMRDHDSITKPSVDLGKDSKDLPKYPRKLVLQNVVPKNVDNSPLIKNLEFVDCFESGCDQAMIDEFLNESEPIGRTHNYILRIMSNGKVKPFKNLQRRRLINKIVIFGESNVFQLEGLTPEEMMFIDPQSSIGGSPFEIRNIYRYGDELLDNLFRSCKHDNIDSCRRLHTIIQPFDKDTFINKVTQPFIEKHKQHVNIVFEEHPDRYDEDIRKIQLEVNMKPDYIPILEKILPQLPPLNQEFANHLIKKHESKIPSTDFAILL